MLKSTRLWAIGLLVASLLAALAVPVQAAGPVTNPAPQSPVPTPSSPLKVSIQGVVINWAYRNEPGVQVTLGGGSWSMETDTDTDGKFNFSNLGEGVGLLNPLLPKGSPFQPLTTDLAVPLTDGVNRTVNLGVYGGKQVPTGLPMSVGMKASAARVKPEGTVKFMITVKNNMDHAEGDVLVTDMLPAGLTPTQIQTSKGTAWIGGQFAAAAIGQMDKGLTEAVTITAQMNANASPEKALVNRASVIYPESVAVQAQVTLNESSEVTAAHLPETGYGYGLSLLALMLGAVIMGLRALRLGRRPA